MHFRKLEVDRLLYQDDFLSSFSFVAITQLNIQENNVCFDMGSGPSQSVLNKMSTFSGQKGLVVGIEKELFFLKPINSNIKFICCDVNNLPLKSNFVDIIYSRFLFPHIRNPIIVLNNFSRILKNEGKLLIEDFDFANIEHFPPNLIIKKSLSIIRMMFFSIGSLTSKAFTINLIYQSNFTITNLETSTLYLEEDTKYTNWIKNAIYLNKDLIIKKKFSSESELNFLLAELEKHLKTTTFKIPFYHVFLRNNCI